MPKRDSLAVVSVVLGLASFLVFILAPFAIAAGLYALRRIGRSSGSLKGRRIAISGIIIGAAGLVFIFFAMLGHGTYRSFRVPTVSMQPTIKSKERIAADLKAYKTKDPARGDIVIYEIIDKGKRRMMCKRIVGLPGEDVEIKAGGIYVNGVLTEIPGLPGEVSYVNSGEFGKEGQPVKVPGDSYYLLGDNPSRSFDSRQHGPVSKKDIMGK